jgi:methanogenic corrinoid protein MtbC1
LKYLAGAARMLGDWWEVDLASFTEVTLGTSRMYAIMRAMRYEMPIPSSAATRTAIFASVPGETHTLGVRMAADLFRKDGWKIDLRVADTHDSLVSGIVQSDTHLVGISVGGAHSLQALSRLIIALRIEKPTARILVSGHITEEAKDAIDLIGVDGMATDIETAKQLMESLWRGLQR